MIRFLWMLIFHLLSKHSYSSGRVAPSQSVPEGRRAAWKGQQLLFLLPNTGVGLRAASLERLVCFFNDSCGRDGSIPSSPSFSLFLLLLLLVFLLFLFLLSVSITHVFPISPLMH